MKIKPPKSVSGGPPVKPVKYVERDWTCNCGEHHNEGPYCKGCCFEEYQRWKAIQ